MKYTLVILFSIFTLPALAQESNATMSDLINQSQNAAFRNLLDSENYDKRNIIMVAEDGTRIKKSQKDMDDALKLGSQYYKEENYADAFSQLSEVAVMGNKSAQTIIGMMYLQGQHVTRSTVTGMGWLGVASESKNKDAKKAFKQVYSQLSDEHKQVIDQTVAGYVSKYGIETQNIICKKKKKVGSNISESICLKSANSESPLYPII